MKEWYSGPFSLSITPAAQALPAEVAATPVISRARKPIRLDPGAGLLVMSPDGAMLYALDVFGILTPVSTAAGKALRPIRLGDTLAADVAVTPDSRFVYVGLKGGQLIPFRTTTGKRGRVIRLPGHRLIDTFVIAP
jgi:hypothetical protein